MELESYTCENCILQRLEVVYHLFLRCNFARACWESIGVLTPRVNCPMRAVTRIKRQLKMPSAMEIIILMAWSIWKCRNGWLFENIAPTVARCRIFFAQELKWLQLRVNPSIRASLSSWMDQVDL
jgi:hypothetical protein